MVSFLNAALRMLEERNWFSVPMGMTAQGLPKRGLLKDVYQLPTTREAIEAMPWSDAVGLALVLGPASRNLRVLDVDHEATFSALIAALGFSEAPRLVRSMTVVTLKSVTRHRKTVKLAQKEFKRNRQGPGEEGDIIRVEPLQWDGAL